MYMHKIIHASINTHTKFQTPHHTFQWKRTIVQKVPNARKKNIHSQINASLYICKVYWFAGGRVINVTLLYIYILDWRSALSKTSYKVIYICRVGFANKSDSPNCEFLMRIIRDFRMNLGLLIHIYRGHIGVFISYYNHQKIVKSLW